MIYEFLYSMSLVIAAILLVRSWVEIKELQRRNMKLRIDLIQTRSELYMALQIKAVKSQKEKYKKPEPLEF